MENSEKVVLIISIIALAVIGFLILRHINRKPLEKKLKELQVYTKTDLDRNLLEDFPEGITLGEIIELSQEAESIYTSYILTKYKDKSILSFPASYFFDENGGVITSSSNNLFNSGNPTTEGINLMVSSTFKENIVVNVSICGKIKDYHDLKFVTDLNLHAREQVQGIIVCNGSGAKFVTVCITNFFDTENNSLKSRLNVHPQGETGVITLETGTEFYLLCSYKVYNENINSTNVNLEPLRVDQNVTYCR